MKQIGEIKPSNEVLQIVEAAKIFGPQIQLDCAGYMANKRQWMMCGLAVIDVAQQLKSYWQYRKTQEGSPVEFTWRKFYDIIVKWRQYSEPNDPVVWVDMLTPEQFNEGFGSHTPMVTGQTDVVRYFPMFQKSFPIMKQLISQTGISVAKQAEFQEAQTLEEAFSILGRDFWVCTPCESIAFPGKVYEGTRLTLQVRSLHLTS